MKRRSARATADKRDGPVLELVDVRRLYGTGDSEVRALDGVSLALRTGSFTAVMGPSGSGKSTFLHCAAGLDQPTSGRVLLDGEEFTYRSEAAVTRFRRQRVGFVFQHLNLLPTLTALQNVALPSRLAGRKVDLTDCARWLERVGLHGRLDARPAELSGGQQQRVAIARALAMRPSVIFADEPTGALDVGSGQEVLALLAALVREVGVTIVMVTHDPVAAAHAGAVVFLRDGRVVGELQAPTARAVAERMTGLGDELASRRQASGR